MTVHEHQAWRRTRSATKLVVLFAAVLLLIAIGATLLLPNLDAVASARAGLDRYSVLLMSVRLMVIGLLWFFWMPLMQWLYKSSALKALVYMRSRRNYFALVFIAVELLLIQNVVGWLWGLIAS